jgi:hypothetical protein
MELQELYWLLSTGSVLEKLLVHSDLQHRIYFSFRGFGCSGYAGHIFFLYADGKWSTVVLLCLESFPLRFQLYSFFFAT